MRHGWRRSLQVRVATATMLLSALVVITVGDSLLVRIRDGLLASSQSRAISDASGLIQDLQAKFDAAPISDQNSAREAVTPLVGVLAGASEENSSLPTRTFVMLRALSSDSPEGIVRESTGPGVGPDAIPDDLRERVNYAKPLRVQGRLISLSTGTGGQTVPAFAVGSLVDIPLAGQYEIYLVYPLRDEQGILDLVQTSFAVGALAMVALVVGVAVVVTRQVVSPVRQAARTAEQLSSGRLDRRMRVRGEDDLARLGRAFNEMADGLERQITRLEELSRVQRRFVSDVSHELRTPLTTVRMAAEVIYEARSGFDPALARSAELLANQLDRFEALLADLLEISRFDAGAALLDIEPRDVGQVVARVVEALHPLADRKGSPLVLSLPSTSAIAEVDPRRVDRVVRNLVANAIEHGEGLPIEITVAIDEHTVAVGVRDHGVGLRPQEVGMVFNRFWRGDPARARTTGGTGLGLAIALEDAHLHAGWLQVWGEPGEGAHFLLTLPRAGGVTLTASPISLVPPEVQERLDAEQAGTAEGDPAQAQEPGPGDGLDPGGVDHLGGWGS